MHQMAVDIEQRRAIVLSANDVCVEEFVVERAASHDVQTNEKGTDLLILCGCSVRSRHEKRERWCGRRANADYGHPERSEGSRGMPPDPSIRSG